MQKDLVKSSVAEFLGCWALGGKATLTLNTVMVSPLFPSPPPSLDTQSLPSTLLLILLVLHSTPGLGPSATAGQPRGSVTVYELLATKQL